MLILLMLIFILIPSAMAFRNVLTPSILDRYSSERSNIGFLNTDNYWTGNNTFLNVTYLNENVEYVNITYNITDLDFDYVNILGSSLTGSSGNPDRTYDANVDMIAIDNSYLQPDIDYTYVGTTITFLNPVWDDQQITLWNTEFNILSVNYVGSAASGSDGNSNRNLAVQNVLQIVVDNNLLHPDTDYSYDGTTIIFLNPLWDTQKITVWKQ